MQISLKKQQIKSNHRRQYVRKQKASDPCNTSKEDDLDLLGDDMEAFSGSQADLEGAADNLFSSPPRPQPLHFESLSLKTPQTIPPIPDTTLQNKRGSRLEKSMGSHFSIQLQQQMGVFQASMLEAMKSLLDEMHSMKKSSEMEVDKTSASVSKAGPSKQAGPTLEHLFSRMLNQWTPTFMVLHFLHGFLKVSSPTMLPSTRILNPTTQILIPRTARNNQKWCVPKLKNTRTKENTRFGQSIILGRLLQRKCVLCPYQKVY